MHITEGVAPASVAAAGALLAAGGVALGLRAMKDEQIPRAALVASAIFVASLVIRLPLGPSSVHPVLNGLAGVLLGWAAMPAFLVALFLQALLFQFGGITTLGINTVTMGFPAVACYYLFSRRIRESKKGREAFLLGVAAGVTALTLSFVLWAGSLILSGKQLAIIVKLSLLPHLAIVTIEGIFTGFIVGFLARVYPKAFEMPHIIKTRSDP
ncbi:MAG: cobalt transporter CbiM [Verrucomicrobia bacterium]|jgi:cobalt/nickel transport system permease protein|nr:cobalt transporter CbiM [Verrucomicrobiota bacterium]